VSKQPPYGLVIAWPVLEIDGRRGVAELMRCDSKPNHLLDAFSNLLAELKLVLRLTALTRKQPGNIRSAKQRWPELVNIFTDQVRQGLIEFEVQIDAVFTS
jgi:hypothetical protein